MNRKSGLRHYAALAIVAFSTTAEAQTVVRDSDNEARNEYQESCFTSTSGPNSEGCTLPPLPQGKRLAIRYVSAFCNDTAVGTRNPLLSGSGRLGFEVLPVSNRFVPRRVSSSRSEYIVSEPVYLYSDVPVQISVRWEGDGRLSCGSVGVIGYLVTK